MSDGNVIETRDLSKSFNGRVVIEDVSFGVPKGSIFGFLGPNGSGKTTTIRMILGLVSPDSGEVALFGETGSSARRHQLGRIGTLVEGPGFYPFLSGPDNLARFAQVAFRTQKALSPQTGRLGRTQIMESLDRVGLGSAGRKKYRAYSLGMKQRLSIAAALLWPRQLLVLDEPTNGLDPQGMVEVRQLLLSLQREGMTIFVSSHILSEIEMVCSHLAVMRDGRLVFEGTSSQFRGSMGETFHLECNDVSLARSVLIRFGFADSDSISIDGDRLSTKLNVDSVERVVAELVHSGVGIRAVGNRQPSLEDAFVALTGGASAGE